VTAAERTDPDGQRHGAAVFDPSAHAWRIDRDADWRHPQGRGSSIAGRDFFPVVQVAYEDALAYAIWRGRRLPTENEWERAARGDAPASPNLHAEAFAADGTPAANTWQGVFPVIDRGADGFAGLAPVGCFPANAAGLYDMVGNVWEWTADFYSAKHEPDSPKACCIPSNPRGGLEAESFDPRQPEIRIPRRVVKGGSHLCAPNYCRRYRPAARHAEQIDSSTSHIGFRCVVRARPSAPTV